MAEFNKPSAGLGVDASGGPVVDPTANVIALTEAANKRQDDLREANDRMNELRISCQKELSDLREKHAEVIRKIQSEHTAELSKAESDRLNSIRQVDREDVNKTAAQVLAAVQTLASQNLTTAETLRNQVATTQMASQNTFNQTVAEFNKRISQLELSTSEGKGKQALADPMMMELVAEMKATNKAMAMGGGKTEGISQILGWIVGIAGAVVAAIVFIMKG